MGRNSEVKRKVGKHPALGAGYGVKVLSRKNPLYPLPDLPKVKGPMWGTIECGEAVKADAPVGKKLDVGKSPVTRGVLWYFPRALLAVADVSAYGVKKYDLAYEDKDWMKVPDGFGRYADAEGRHLIKQSIHPVDKESNLRHIQMEAWNALAKLELTLIELEKDGTVNFD